MTTKTLQEELRECSEEWPAALVVLDNRAADELDRLTLELSRRDAELVEARADKFAQPLAGVHEYRIVFDGPPGPVAGRFIDVEDEHGMSFKAGEWEQRGEYWHLVIHPEAETTAHTSGYRAGLEAAKSLAHDAVMPLLSSERSDAELALISDTLIAVENALALPTEERKNGEKG